MPIDFKVLCEYIADEYRIEYIVIDKEFVVKSFSQTVERFSSESLVVGQDIREPLYELIGYEDELIEVSSRQKKDFQLHTIGRRSHYFDIHIKRFDASGALVIFLTNTTEQIDAHQRLLQERNEYELVSRELLHESRQKDKMMMLQSRQVQMGEMISMIAHQWKQPLGILAVLTHSLYLKFTLGKLDAQGMDKFQKNSQKQIEQMSRTIDDFRNFFKPEKKKILFDIAKPIRHALDLLDPVLKQENVLMSVALPKNTMIMGYPNELGQVFINIINNAKDALSKRCLSGQKSITIDTLCGREYVSVRIGDNGGGVPIDMLDTIFDPYVSTKLEKDGTGLGLYMGKMIIEKHMQGSISVENREQGALFTVRLPLDEC